MSIALSCSSSTRTPIWERPAFGVAKWSATLSRITSIYSELPLTIYRKTSAKKTNTAHEEVAALKQQEVLQNWNSFHQEITAPTLPQDQALAKLNEYLTLFPADLANVYRADFTSSQGSVAERINRLTKDFFSATQFSVKESFLGNDGVLLLRYPRSATDSTSQWTEESVIKWTSPVEAASCDILRIFSDEICVQKASFLDFDQNLIIRSSSKEPLPQEFAQIIQGNLISTRTHFSQKSLSTQNIMISERLKGANLADLIDNEWSNLTTEHKTTTFNGIGKLALIDLIMGNRDRFTAFDLNTQTLDDWFVANLGNLMVATGNPENAPTLYAIDNGVQEEHLTIGDDHVSYNNCLNTLLRTIDWKELVATSIVRSLSKPLESDSVYFEEKRETAQKRNSLQPKIEAFKIDLSSSTTFTALIDGLTSMEESLKVKFNSAEFHESLNAIQEKYAVTDLGVASQVTLLCTAVQARINLFLNR